VAMRSSSGWAGSRSAPVDQRHWRHRCGTDMWVYLNFTGLNLWFWETLRLQ